MNLKTHLPYLLSAGTLLLMHFAGKKWRWTWIYALALQILWTTWYFAVQAWGLLPLAVCLTFVYIKNHLSWNPSHNPFKKVIK